MKRRNYFWGILLILVGGIGILDRGFDIKIFSYAISGYLVLLALGLVFELSFFLGKNIGAGVLVPGGILITLGVMRLLEYFTKGECSIYFGAVSILSVAIGLGQLYWFGGRNKGLLIPICVLTVVSIISMLSVTFRWINLGLVFPVILVVTGGYILYNNSRNSE